MEIKDLRIGNWIYSDDGILCKIIGFKEECLAWYVTKEFGLVIGEVKGEDLIRDALLAPTFGQVFSWAEENFGIYVSIEVDRTTYPKWAFEISYFLGIRGI